MKETSRRAVLASIAAAPAVAVPALAVAAPETGFDPKAALARLEEVIDTLRTSFVCNFWHECGGMDEAAATRALAYFRAGCPEGSPEAEAEQKAAFTFISSHGQSLDWIMFGDPGGLICRAAQHSRRALTIFAGYEAAS